MQDKINKNRFIVGLTGGIGSGKTSVSDIFQSLGIDIIDADVIARNIVNKGSRALELVVDAFSNNVLQSNGELDRAKLREIIFKDDGAKDKLNQILHPIIRQKIISQLNASTSDYCILSAPLLFENKLNAITHRDLVVDVDEQTQLNRTLARDGSSNETIKGIIAAQMSRTKRLELADDVIDNSGALNALNTEVKLLHEAYLKRSKSQKPLT